MQTLHLNSVATCPLCSVKLPPIEMIGHMFDAHQKEKWEVTMHFVSPVGAPEDVEDDES